MALVMQLASEFQGFARDLHDEGSERFALWALPTNAQAAGVIRNALRTDRQLDRVNAQPQSMAADFGRFGMSLWKDLQAIDARTIQHEQSLALLNRARNGIAHGNEAALHKLRAEGVIVSRATLTQWRADLNRLAANLDQELIRQLGVHFGRLARW